jgi:acetyl esterase/lipase
VLPFRHVSPALLISLFLAAPSLAQDARLPEGLVYERDIEYGKGGEVSLKLDVIRPKEDREKARPVIVWIHGGGWQNGNKASGAGRLAPFVSSGDYAGVSVGYRLSGVATWPAQIHDCKAAIRWVRANAKKYNFDPDKIGVWGSSAGGHLVSLLGTSGDVKELEGENGSSGWSSRVACVVDFCGPSDFLAFGKESPRMNTPGQPVFKLFGGPLGEHEAAAKAASPVTHVSKDDPPFLIMHGTADNTVPISQADLFNAALTKASVDSTYVKIDAGGHGFGGPEVQARVKAFFDKRLLGKDVAVSGEAIRQQ